jgi:flagellar motor switch protein FliG
MDGIKKTALLLSGLEWQTVDLLLGRLDYESAKAVRHEMMSLKSVSQKETNQLANEFLHKAARITRQTHNIIEHQLTQYHKTYNTTKPLDNTARFEIDAFVPSSQPLTSQPLTSQPLTSQPFDFLRSVETEDIVREIIEEHPQTVTVVLAHLPASRAGKILGCLPETLQNEVTKRLAEFKETDKQILNEIELSLQERLEHRRYSETRRTKGNAVLRKIFEVSQTTQTQEPNRQQYNITTYNTPTNNTPTNNTTEFPNQSYTFDDLERLDNTKLAVLFRSVDTVTVLISLIGAKPSLIERVTKRFSPTEEYQMRQQLKYLGTINENDVIRARNILLDKAKPIMQ